MFSKNLETLIYSFNTARIMSCSFLGKSYQNFRIVLKSVFEILRILDVMSRELY
jgi:hypothetical protein